MSEKSITASLLSQSWKDHQTRCEWKAFYVQNRRMQYEIISNFRQAKMVPGVGEAAAGYPSGSCS
jgi:hypothetical protein